MRRQALDLPEDRDGISGTDDHGGLLHDLKHNFVFFTPMNMDALNTGAGNTKGGSIIVQLTSCLTGLD